MPLFTLPALREKLASVAQVDHSQDEATAAVAAILRPGPGAPGSQGVEILLIERAEREGDPWSGHLAFPGGKRDPLDVSLLATSIRETREEVGLALDPTWLLARLDDVQARINGLKVAHFVFAVEEPVSLLLKNAEVKETLWVPLERIARDQGKETFTRSLGDKTIDLPCIRLGGRVLWGMTHRMVMQLVSEASG
jgi:ADP-ribose pyrophosphatase YjhB (NUDIX family)